MTDPSVILQVINLDRSPDRLDWMTTALGQQGIAFSRLPAVDGKDRPPEALGDYDPERSRKLFGRELLTGEVGCFQSHLNAARAFLDGSHDIGLVLEDDVNVPDGFAGMIETLQRLAGQIGLENWDVMQIGRPTTKFFTPLQITGLPEGFPAPLRASYLPVTTHAIVWSRQGAQRFLDKRSCIIMPVDNTLKSHICRVGGGIGFDKALVRPLNQGSLINDGDPRARKGRRSKISRFHVISTRRRFVNYWLAARQNRRATG